MSSSKTGVKKPLTIDEVRAIRTILASSKSSRDRVLFEIAIASSLREGDVLALKVSDVTSAGEVLDTIEVTPTKTSNTTGVKVSFQLTDYAKQALKDHISDKSLSYGDYLFTRSKQRTGPVNPLTKRAFLDLLKSWVFAIGLNPQFYGTHSLRRTRPSIVYAETKNIRACQIQLGHKSITTTQKYLGVEQEEALAIFKAYQI